MGFYKVQIHYDAYAVFETVLDADDPQDAISMVQDPDYDGPVRNTYQTKVYDPVDIFESNVADISADDALAWRNEPDQQMYLLNERERDIIIAALRLWQRSTDIPAELYEIAESDTGRFLSDGAIDTLIEDKLNV